MPGAPIMHGSATSTAPQGMGGAARVATSTKSTNDMAFFIWLAIIGIIIPGIIIGSLKVGGFQFVFKHR